MRIKILSSLLVVILTTIAFACGTTNDISSEVEKDEKVTETVAEIVIEKVEKENPKYQLYDDKENGHLITEMSLTVDNKAINLPCTVKELIDFGFEPATNLSKTKYDYGEELFVKDDKKIYVHFFNYADSTNIEDYYVRSINTTSEGISINGIKINSTKYEEVLEKLGLDNNYRLSSHKDEIDKSNFTDYNWLEYSADANYKPIINNETVSYCFFSLRISPDYNGFDSIDLRYESN